MTPRPTTSEPARPRTPSPVAAPVSTGGPLFPAGVLLDMDGTLIDTEGFWHRSEVALVEAHGGTWTEEQALALVGTSIDHSARTIVATTGIDIDPVDVQEGMVQGVLDIEEAEGLPWLPGAHELLVALRDAQVPCALVTSSFRRLTPRLLAEAPEGALRAVVAAEDVEHHKPAPDPYLLGAHLLGLDPGRCVAIEDSPSGVAAARTAGCRVLAVPRTVEIARSDDVSRAPSLTVVDLGVLSRIAAGQTLDLTA